MSKYLDQEGLQKLWAILDTQNSEVVKRIKKLSQDLQDNVYVLYDTTDGWNAQKDLQSEKGVIYIYSDYKWENGSNIAGIKVGDGNAYLYDMPFLDTLYDKHINNLEIHITSEERKRWNNKVTSDIDGETLILSKT